MYMLFNTKNHRMPGTSISGNMIGTRSAKGQHDPRLASRSQSSWCAAGMDNQLVELDIIPSRPPITDSKNGEIPESSASLQARISDTCPMSNRVTLSHLGKYIYIAGQGN